MMMTTEIAFDTSDVSTCPHSTDERATGIELNRATIPFWVSLKIRTAVYETPLAMAISRMPGSM